MAFREAKWIMACFCCAAQNIPPVQRSTASSSCFLMCDPQTGQLIGMEKIIAVSGRLLNTTLTTSGITSPALLILTVSPIRTSLRRISSSLCSVAFVTVTPPTKTGFRRAIGVIAPVRPTWTSMPSTIVSASSAGNLWAIAHLGARDTKPNSACWDKAFTL